METVIICWTCNEKILECNVYELQMLLTHLYVGLFKVDMIKWSKFMVHWCLHDGVVICMSNFEIVRSEM